MGKMKVVTGCVLEFLQTLCERYVGADQPYTVPLKNTMGTNIKENRCRSSETFNHSWGFFLLDTSQSKGSDFISDSIMNDNNVLVELVGK